MGYVISIIGVIMNFALLIFGKNLELGEFYFLGMSGIIFIIGGMIMYRVDDLKKEIESLKKKED